MSAFARSHPDAPESWFASSLPKGTTTVEADVCKTCFGDGLEPVDGPAITCATCNGRGTHVCPHCGHNTPHKRAVEVKRSEHRTATFFEGCEKCPCEKGFTRDGRG